jgi:hypothetical protein
MQMVPCALGNVIVGITSRANGVVESVSGNTFIMSTNRFIEGERVIVYNQNMTPKRCCW